MSANVNHVNINRKLPSRVSYNWKVQKSISGWRVGDLPPSTVTLSTPPGDGDRPYRIRTVRNPSASHVHSNLNYEPRGECVCHDPF